MRGKEVEVGSSCKTSVTGNHSKSIIPARSKSQGVLNFRPVVWSTTEGVFNASGQGPVAGISFPKGIQTDPASVDCMVTITESILKEGSQITRSYQNIPTPVSMFYSGGVNYGSGTPNLWENNCGYFPDFEIPHGVTIPIDYYLPKGSAVTFKITPIFAERRLQLGQEALGIGASPPVVVEFNRQTEYQIRVFLQGYKIAGETSW